MEDTTLQLSTGPSSMAYNPDISAYGNVDYTPSDEMYTENQPERPFDRPERPKTSRGRRRAEAPPRPESRRARPRRSRQDFDPDLESYGRPASRVGFSPESSYRYSHDEYSRQVSYGSDSTPSGDIKIPQNSPTNTPTDMYCQDEDIYPRTPPQEEVYTHTENRDQLIISPSQSPSHRDRHKKKHAREVMSVSPIQRDEAQIKTEDLHHEQSKYEYSHHEASPHEYSKHEGSQYGYSQYDYSKPVQYQSDRLYQQHYPESYSASQQYRDSPQYGGSPQYTSHSPQHMPKSSHYTQHGVSHRDSPQYSVYSQRYTQQSPQYRDSPYRESPSQRESPYRSPPGDYPDSGSPEAHYRPPRSQRPKSARPKTGRKKSARQRQRHYEQETSQPVQYDAATILSSGDPYGRPSSSLSRYKPLPAIGASTPRSPPKQEASQRREPDGDQVDELGTKTEKLVLHDEFGPAGNVLNETDEDTLGASSQNAGSFTGHGIPSVDILTNLTREVSKDIYEKSLSNYEQGLPSEGDEKLTSGDQDRYVAMDKMQPLDSKHNLPSEPSETEERLLLAIKLPDGQRIQRFFRPSDQLNSVLHFAENSSLSDFSEYDLVCNVPKVVFYDLTQCIQDTELKDRTVLYLEEKE